MNNQAFSKIWIIVVFVTVIAGGILVWQYLIPMAPETEVAPEEVVPSVEEEIKVQEEITKDEITDWKTYRNEEYSFKISYPPNSQINEDLQAEKIYDDIVEFLFPQNSTKNIRVTIGAINEIDIYANRDLNLVASRELAHDLLVHEINITIINRYNVAIAKLINMDIKDRVKAYVAFIAHPYRNLYLEITMTNSIRPADSPYPWSLLYPLDLKNLTEQDFSKFNQILATFRFLE